jgi:ABC-2 type transport system ATP-binding protein
MLVQVDAGGDDPVAAFQGIEGVVAVRQVEGRDGIVSYEVESERGRDVRRDIAKAAVGRQWGLLELRPVQMSLEDVFLHLTTEEQHDEEVARA